MKNPFAAPAHVGDIRPISEGDVHALRIPWDSRYTPDEIERIIEMQPRLSIWNTNTGEFIIGGLWRHRTEIATPLQLAASGGALELLQYFVEHCASLGMRMVVASEQVERRKHQFYEAAGMVALEDIIVYELARIRSRASLPGELRFEHVERIDAVTLDELEELDHQAFPWMWWNSRQEFEEYATAPGVQIHIGRDSEGCATAYVGVTRYRTWGHLDRIAVRPDAQGRGFGRDALDYAVNTLARSGARRVGLSTQARNSRSRRLYEAYGFRRSPSHDYRIYGRRLADNESEDREG